ncbi:Putative taurine catabolism dioxygenase TauD/TfdA [Paraburkholderia xenovorans LB400]|uniref:Taurine catabolism dioxygenase TauD/TfdA n=2 Tax=Paraburkholderia xenovorans TaxID=36873 RepID=Q13GI4_PARXL|nr:Putative taurine catabolism dioxygenase TauD/TfdA [Paraburkholderia xenovorans LB400]
MVNAPPQSNNNIIQTEPPTMATLLQDDFELLQQRQLPEHSYSAQSESRFGIHVEPYSPVVGARVRGLRINGKETVPAEVRAFLYDSLTRYGFLAFEPGTVSAAEFAYLVDLFGHSEYTGTPYTPVAEESSNVNTIDSKVKKTRMNFIWHIDQAFRPEPPRFTVLFGKKVPPFGGDTVFTNATAAYELLDPLFAQYLETLSVAQDVETMGFLTLAYREEEELARQKARFPWIRTPLIRVHPDTGKKQIYVNELYTQRILGLSRIASQNILGILFDLIKSPEVLTRYRWEEGSVLIWDNRVVQHRGVGDYGEGHRVLLRAVVE